MQGNAIRTCLFCSQSGLHYTWIFSPTRLAYGCDVIDVNAQFDHFKNPVNQLIIAAYARADRPDNGPANSASVVYFAAVSAAGCNRLQPYPAGFYPAIVRHFWNGQL